MGTWARRIGGGALVLSLAGLSAPATTSARIYQDDTPEVIEIEDEAPWDPSMEMGGHTGAGAPNSYPSGGDSGGGPIYGGGSVPSGGDTSTEERASQQRLAAAKNNCTNYGGSWGPATFKDFYDEDLVHIGYVCITQPTSTGEREWRYYESDGILNHTCNGDSEVQVCQGA
jgi:hypothetical protein